MPTPTPAKEHDEGTKAKGGGRMNCNSNHCKPHSNDSRNSTKVTKITDTLTILPINGSYGATVQFARSRSTGPNTVTKLPTLNYRSKLFLLFIFTITIIILFLLFILEWLYCCNVQNLLFLFCLHIRNKHERKKERVREHISYRLKDVQSVSFTTDIWSSGVCLRYSLN